MSYPQLFKTKEIYTNVNNETEAIFLYNYSDTDKSNFEKYLSSINNEKIPLFDLNSETDDMSIAINEDELYVINKELEDVSIGQFNKTAIGGSFDHPHVGHKANFLNLYRYY